MVNFFCTPKFNVKLSLLTILLSLTACDSRGGGQAAEYGNPLGTFATVDFDTLKNTVLTPYCVQCHSGFSTAAGIASYVIAGNPAGSSLYTEAASGAMPPGGPTIPSAALVVIDSYITQLGGAQIEETPATAPVETTTAITYQMLKSDVLTPSCLNCHSAFSSESGLRSYILAGNPDKSPLYSESASGAMPPGGPALTAAQLTEIRSYISDLTQ